MNSTNQLISVIIPAYNSGKYIAATITSVCVQTYKNLEVIVIDDGSTDDTEAAVKAVNDPRIRYIKTANQGNYFARNRGLKEAKGEFVTFLDADDIVLPEKFEKQVSIFDSHPGLGLCCTNFYVQYAGRENKIFENNSFSFKNDFETSTGFIEKAIENNFIVTSSVMIRRECYDRLGPFDTTFQNAMDYEFFLRIIFNYPAYYMSDRLMTRLEHDSNISKNKVNSLKALLYIFSDCAKQFMKGKLYRHVHSALIQKKWQKSLYYLGLEYLAMGNYAESYRCLTECQYSEKRLFKAFATLAAKTNSRFLTSFVIFYRWRKQQERIVSALNNSDGAIRVFKDASPFKRNYTGV